MNVQLFIMRFGHSVREETGEDKGNSFNVPERKKLMSYGDRGGQTRGQLFPLPIYSIRFWRFQKSLTILLK